MRLQLRAPSAVSAIAVTATAALLPLAAHRLGSSVSFVPAMLGIVACFDVLSVYLLIGDYLDNGDMRLLAMAWAYLWSLALMTGYSLAFPGVWSGTPLASTRSVAPYLYLGWHAGFPALIGLAWAPWQARATPSRVRRGRALSSCALVLTMATGVIAAIVASARSLPTLIVGLDTHRMATVTAPFVVPVVVLALLSTRRGVRRRSGPERWASVTVLVCLCDLVLTYSSRYRFSLGWYAGRALTLTGAAVVAVAMLAEFRRIKQLAEMRAATDPLTGLPNRRALEVALNAELARAARTGRETSVLLLDLDGFKAVNDALGHAGGDALLVETTAAWAARLRMGDLLARLGGDEFVVILPDTGADGASFVAAKLAAATPPVVGVSVGVALTAPGAGAVPVAAELLVATADADMYGEKLRRRESNPEGAATSRLTERRGGVVTADHIPGQR